MPNLNIKQILLTTECEQFLAALPINLNCQFDEVKEPLESRKSSVLTFNIISVP